MKEDSSTLPRRQKVRRSWTISNPSNNKEADLSRTLSSSVPPKFHRRKGQQDENIPPEKSREKPRRRFSMSSIDSFPKRIKSPSRGQQDKSKPGSHNTNIAKEPSPNRSRPSNGISSSSRNFQQPNQHMNQHNKDWHQPQRELLQSNRDSHIQYRDSHNTNRDVHQLHRNTRHPSRDVHQPYNDAHYQNQGMHHPRSRELYQNRENSPVNRRHMQHATEKPGNCYFFGDVLESPCDRDTRRSSTLPRQPRPSSRSNQMKNDDAEIRFHSMPRTRNRAAQSHRTQPDLHVKESRSSEGIRFPNRFSSPIRTEIIRSQSNAVMPVKPNVSCERQIHRNCNDFPSRQTGNINIGKSYRPPDVQKERDYPRNWSHSLPRQNSEFIREMDYKKERVHKIYMEGNQDLDTRRELTPQLGLASCLTSEIHQAPLVNCRETHYNKAGVTTEMHHSPIDKCKDLPYSKVSRSKTSVSPGYGNPCQTEKNRSQMRTPVKRSQSFQPNSNSATTFSSATEPKGNVAKFVQDIERGMHMNNKITGSNRSQLTGDVFNSECYEMQTNSLNRFSSSDHIQESYNEGNEHMESFPAIDSNKLLPDGDDYKLVFISSDSSKDSEQNNSVESDIISSYEQEGMDPRYIKPIYENSNARKYTDIAVMTEMDNSSADETSLLDVSMASSLCYPSDSHCDRSSVGTLTSMTALDAEELGLIMQQTVVVQAEAQALQQALMSAFEFESNSYQHKNEVESNNATEFMNLIPYANQLTSETSNNVNIRKNSEELKYKPFFSNIDLPKTEPNKFVPQFTLKEKRNVAIQANLSIASSETDESEQESYYDSSMLDSEDEVSQYKCVKGNKEDCMPNNSLYLEKPDKSTDKICPKKEGQNTFTHPPYLSGYPPSVPQITPPDNHLQLTLNCEDSVSVLPSVREGCEVPLLKGLNRNVYSPVYINSETNVDAKVFNVSKEANGNERLFSGNKSVLNAKCTSIENNYNVFNTLSYKQKNSLTNPPIFPKLSEIKMNSESSNNEYGDINAVGKVISDPLKAQVHAPLQADEESPSSTSDEDTDEEKHVSRSYNVTNATTNESCKLSGTSNTNSDSDSDAHLPHNAYLGENIKTNNDSSELQDKQDKEKEQISNAQNAVLDVPDDNDDINSDSEMKLYLPECDQNISDNPIGTYISESIINNPETINKASDALSDVEIDPYDTSESVVENKSETESNIGIEAESMENKEVEIIKSVQEVPFIAKSSGDFECGEIINCSKKIESKPPGQNSVSNQNEYVMPINNVETIVKNENVEENFNTSDTLKNLNASVNISENSISVDNLKVTAPVESIKFDVPIKTEETESKTDDISLNSNVHCSIDRELAKMKITGSRELEQDINSCENESVAVGNSSERGGTSINEKNDFSNYNKFTYNQSAVSDIRVCEPRYSEESCITEIGKNISSEGESTKLISCKKYGGKENTSSEIVSSDMGATDNQVNCQSKLSDHLLNDNKVKVDKRPVPPLRKTKRSSSSDGLSSSSDIERSDIDASDSADTIVENLFQNIITNKKPLQKNKKQNLENQGNITQCGSESHCSDNSEEGNLVSIVAVGEYSSPKPQTQGKIYIRSNSTDSDVQINPTCIVLTGDTSPESESDGDSDHFAQSIDNCDITILDVNDMYGKSHVMSFKVTSPESSRCPSPAKGKCTDLQSMMRTTQETKQQYRSPIGQKTDSSSLANYFTVTLGSDSPVLPRRANKTPEVRRRKISDGIENTDNSSTPSQGHTPSPTLSHSPNSFEERDAYYEDGPRQELERHGENSYGDYYNEESDLAEVYGGQYDSLIKENDGQFDSIEEFESIEESNYSETSSEDSYDREEEIRYAKRSYNFALHTIIEESCEDSDYDKKIEENTKHDQSELEKYFYFGLGNGPDEPKKYANEESEYSDTFSETSSSVYSEGVELADNEDIDPAELASSRLEKYFKDFLNFERQPSIRSVGEESEIHTDESDSVGSDSEGSPSPEQPRKKLFRSRGVRSVSSSRSHGYSSDKGEGMASDGSHHSGEQEETSDKMLVSGEEEGSTESEENAFEKGDGQFDTIKRRKKKKGACEGVEKKYEMEKADIKSTINKNDENLVKTTEHGLKESNAKTRLDIGMSQLQNESSVGNECNIKQKEEGFSGNDLAVRKYQSRDSGFIGSSDDLLKDKPDDSTKDIDSKELQCSDTSSEDKFETKSEGNFLTMTTQKTKMSKPVEENEDIQKSENDDKSGNEGKVSRSSTGSSADLPNYDKNKGTQPSNLNRKDSFNNWSSDEETNIMMNKMRMFFKNMFSHTHSNSGNKEINKALKIKSPQLMMFETKLTNLMRTVPGINDEQVKEIVEYLSSEDTWSDSYDSSDYTSSDLEGAYARLEQAVPELQSELQKQISVSCQQIIENFDQGGHQHDVGNAQKILAARSFIENNGDPSNKDTFFMYHKIMSSITHAKPDSDRGSVGSGSQSTSPPLLAKVMHYLGNRLVALMHEVSVSSENGDDVDSFTGDNLITSTPRQKIFLPKKYKHHDALSFDSSIDKTSLTSTSFDSEDSPTDTENSPESEIGTPKAGRNSRLSAISEKSSTEDFNFLDNQKNVCSSSEGIRYGQFKKSSGYVPYRILEERVPAMTSTSDSRGKDFETWRRTAVDDRIDVREHGGVSKALSRSGRRADTRKARSHLSLEKIHQEDVKNTGERSESLGDLLDRVKSSGFSSSYEQLDSDSTLRASDSLDRQIGSSSSNIRLNASSRGSLNTSSRGSLAASSRGSLNTSSRGSLPGSSGPEEDEEKKSKKSSFLRHIRRSNILDETKEPFSREIRSTTLPRSTPAQILTTGTLPRSNQPPPQLFASKHHHISHVADRNPASTSTGPRSARYHPPGYRQPSNSNLLPKRTISTPIFKKDNTWHTPDERRSFPNDGPSVSMSVGSLPKASLPNSATGSLRGGVGSSNSSRTASPLGGSLGRASAGSLASFDNILDEDAKRSRTSEYRRNNSLSTLGLKSRSDSLASVCSNGGEGRYGAVSVMGEVQFALQYNYKEGQLECHVMGCRDLAPVDTRRNRSDPYVKAYLLPDKSKTGKKKTKVKRHTLSPVFEEILKFQTTLSDLERRKLWLSVWHYGMFGRNDFLGEVLLPLDDSVLEDSSMKWYQLQDRTEVMEEGNSGAMLVIALKFVPPDALAISGIKTSSGKRRSRGALQVRIKEAADLVSIKTPQNPPDPICKGILLPEKGKTSKQKTSVCRKTPNPRWNHTMTFDDVTLQELTDRSLEISILDHDRFGASEFIGGCRFNLGQSKEEWMDASGWEKKLWEQMLERPNLWVEIKLLLRSAMDRPVYSLNFSE